MELGVETDIAARLIEILIRALKLEAKLHAVQTERDFYKAKYERQLGHHRRAMREWRARQ
jgi:hypothetical protein